MESGSPAWRIERWRTLLDSASAVVDGPPRRTPIGQLVKSLISSRTRDAVSLSAYRSLGAQFGSAAGIAAAEPRLVERAIADVTFADVKAERLVAALRSVGQERPDFRLDFLRDWPMADALSWLERLPGVGRKTSASVMNFSTIARPVLVVDTHVARVLARLGLGRGDATALSERATATMPRWTADDFVTFHAQLKYLGQTLCRWDVPHCAACPLTSLCATAREAVETREPPLFDW